MKKLKKYRALFFDGDGVLWKLNQPLPGIQEIFHLINSQDLKWALLTNNNTQTVEEYINKLGEFNIPANSFNVYSSSTAAAAYLLSCFGKAARIHLIGMPGLQKTLEDSGFIVSTGEEIPQGKVVAVVAGMDPFINFQKITIAMRLIQNGAAFIATNTDGTFPAPEGLYPGTGMIIGALQFSSGVQPFVAGKPHPAIFQAALEKLEIDAQNALMVGDRLETDIKGAAELGIDTAAVLTGIASKEEISQSTIKPDFIFDDLIHLHQELKQTFLS